MHWIVADNVYDEAWRRLLEFANIELTIEDIINRHGRPKKGDQENYRKQAQQVRVCVLQAKEYFEAARHSSLFTSPNHFYYGMVALSSMAMLILGSGSKSLDYLRRDSKNSHHGLNFSTGCDSSQAAKGLLLVEKSWATILPAGHFINWYSTLPARVDHYVSQTKKFPGGSSTSLAACGGTSTAAVSRIIWRKRSMLELLSFLPDLYFDLKRYGISVACAKTSHEIICPDSSTVLHHWLIHELSDPSRLHELLDAFSVPPRHVEQLSYNAIDGDRVWKVSFVYNTPGEASFKWPTSRETAHHDSISYAAEIDTHEVVDCFILAYQLSMLSRYYPDLWISCLESRCKAAKIIERTVDLLISKAPVMMLSLIWAGGITISTHQAPR
jgi:hypothetical protein